MDMVDDGVSRNFRRYHTVSSSALFIVVRPHLQLDGQRNLLILSLQAQTVASPKRMGRF